MTEPIVFVSYSHDSSGHKDWVLKLATDLRARGIDAILDQWDLAPGQDIVSFMEASIARADRVLLVCTSPYVDKADARAGGVGYERLVITGELVQKIDTKKFVPIVRQSDANHCLPRYLGARLYIDFSNEALYGETLEQLAREVHGSPRSSKPPLGPNPFTGVPPAVISTSRHVAVTGRDMNGESIVADPWFAHQHAKANERLTHEGRKGAMEIRSALHAPVAKSQLELLNAIRKAEIRTFGWPIGILLENQEEYRPRPVSDGVMAEVAIKEKGLSGTSSYDYWIARTNGDFYLLQSLFEDERATEAIFFDTRIVRVTEAFMFLAGLYENVGVPPETRVTVGITHLGLEGRTLTTAGRRHVFPRKTTNSTSAGEITSTVGGLRERLSDNVRLILEPMFMLFDFAEFDRNIYEGIIEQFAAGHVT